MRRRASPASSDSLRTPPQRSTTSPAEHGLGFEVGRDAAAAELAADPGLLEAAERHIARGDQLVDHHAAGANLARNLAAVLGIAGRDVAEQAVRRVVGD